MLKQIANIPSLLFRKPLLALLFSVSVITIAAGIFLLPAKHADATSNATINFQARLLSNNGALVPDGNYNVEFKIYSGSSCNPSSGSGCTTDWTEDWFNVNGGGQGIRVSDGYLTANLGTYCPLDDTSTCQGNSEGTIPWGSPVWLSINIGGTTLSSPTLDGTMFPYLSMTSVPAAMSLTGTNGTYTSTLAFQSPNASQSILLPNDTVGATEYVCYQNDTGCGFAPTSGSGNYIQNAFSATQTANFNIQGSSSSAAVSVIEAYNGGTGDNLDLKNGTGALVASFGNTGNVLVQTSTNSSTALQIQNSDGESILQAGTTAATNYVTDADFTAATVTTCGGSSTFTDWTVVGSPTHFCYNNTATNTYEGATSAEEVLAAANEGFETPGSSAGLTSAPTTNNGADEYYTVSFEAMQTAGAALAANTFTVTGVDATGNKACTGTIAGSGATTLSANGFEQVYCTLQFTSASTGSITQLEIQSSGTTGTIYFDDVQLQLATSAATTAAPSAFQEGNLSLRGVINNPVSLQNVTNSTTALQVQNAAGSNVLNVDTLNNIITVNASGADTATLELNNPSGTPGIEFRSGASGSYSTFIGVSSGSSDAFSGTSGFQNTGIGNGALQAVSSGSYNTGLGVYALNQNALGSYDTAIGNGSLQTLGNGGSNESFDTALGNNTLNNDASGGSNTAIGSYSLYYDNSNYNTAVGAWALTSHDNVSTGQYNTALGYQAGGYASSDGFYTPGSLQNATAIGYEAQVQANNSLVLGSIGGAGNTNVGIGTTIPTNTLSVSPVYYSTGTASVSSTGTIVTGSSTVWTNAMIGMQFIFANGQTGTITAVGSNTSLTLSVSQPVTSAQNYRIQDTGFQVTSAGNAYVQNTSTTAFQVQNAAGSNLVNVDTVNNQVLLGTASGVTGKLVFNNASNSYGVSIVSSTSQANALALTIPADANTSDAFCLSALNNCNSSNSSANNYYLVQVPTNNIGSGTANDDIIAPLANGIVALTVNGTSGTAATAVNINQGGAATGVTINSSSNSATNGLNFTGTFTNLINASNFIVSNAGALTLGGNITFTQAASTITNSTVGDSIALNTAASTTAGTGAINIQSGNATTGSNLSAGAVTIDTGSYTGAGSANLNLGTANAKNIYLGSNTAAISQTVDVGYNSTAASTDNVNIGNLLGASTTTIQGGVNGSTATVSVQAATSGYISIGTVNANTLTVGSTTNANTATNIYGGATGGVSLQTGSGGTISEGTTAQPETITIGDTSTANTGNTQTVNIGNLSGAGTTNVNIGSTTGATAGTTAISGVTKVTVTSGATSETIQGNGDTVQTSTNSSTALQIQNSDGESILQAGTTAATNYVTDADFTAATVTTCGGSSTFTDWTVVGSPTHFCYNNTATNTYEGATSAEEVLAAANEGFETPGSSAGLTSAPTTNNGADEYYTVSFEAMQTAGAALAANTFTVTGVDATGNKACTGTIAGSGATTLSANGFEQVYCTLQFTSASTGSITQLEIQSSGTTGTIYFDDVQLQLATSAATTAAPSAFQEGNLSLRGVINNPVSLQNIANSTTAFQIQDTSSDNLFTADTLDDKVTFGNLTNNTVTVATQALIQANTNNRGLAIESNGTQDSLDLYSSSGSNVAGFSPTGNLFINTGTESLGSTGSNTGLINFKSSGAGSGTITLSIVSNPVSTVTLNLPDDTTGSTICTNAATAVCATAGSGYVQFSPTSAQTDATNNSSIFINKGSSATGDLLELQKNSGDVFAVGNAGALTLGGNITFTQAASTITNSTVGDSIALNTAASTTAGTGAINIQSGNATTGSNLSAGAVTIDTGSYTGAGSANLNLGTANAKNIYLGSNTAAISQTVDVGYNSTAASTDNVNIGNLLGASTTTIQGGVNGSTATVSVQAATSGYISIGTVNANTLTVGSTTNANTATNIYGGATGGVSLQTGSGGTISEGTTAQPETITIGDTSTANTGNTQTVNIGNLSGAGTTNVNIGSTTGATAGTTAISGVTKVTVTSGATSETIQGNGDTVQTSTNSSTALQIQNSDGESILQAGTTAATNYVTDADFTAATVTTCGGSSTFTDWTVVGSPTHFCYNNTATNTYEGATSAEEVLAAANEGFETPGSSAGLTSAPTTNNGADEYYTVSFEAMQTAGAALAANTFTVTGVDATGNKACTGTIAGSGATTLSANGFEQVYCTLQFTSASTGSITQLEIQSSGTTGTIYFDDVQLQLATSAATTAAPSAFQEGNLSLRGVINNPVSLQNVTNSTTALQVQNAAGSNLVDVDTLGSTVNLGTAINTNLNIGTATTSDAITIGGTSTTGNILLQGEGITDTITGASSNPSDILQTTTNSTSALQIRNTSGYNVFGVDTTNNQAILGNSSLENGQLEFLNSNNSDTIQLQAPNTANGTGNQTSSYTLVLPTSSPSKGLCLETSTTNASQLVFSACANSNASISEVNNMQSYYTSGSATTSASFTPANVGDLLVLSTLIPNNSSTGITSISNGSCVGGWTKVITSPSANSFKRVEMWMGTVSATTGCSAFTVTYNSGSGNSNEINISEYTAVGVNGGTTWGVDTNGTNNSGATNSGTITWATLASQDSGELYVGYGQSVSSSGTSGGCAAGFTCVATTDNNVLTYDPGVTAAVSNTPTATQTTSAEFNTVSAVFIVNVSSTAINNQLSVQEANYNVQSGGSGEVAGVLQANSSQNADILDFYNGSGLQGTSTEVLSVLGGSTTAGNIQFGGLTSQAITVATQATTNANGNTLQVAGQQGNGTGNGGVIQIVGGAGGATSGTGGQVTIQGGSATAGVSNGGNVLIQGGAKSSTGTGGSVIIQPLSDNAQAFEVQNQANSYNELSVDTTNNQVVLGTSSHLGGQLEFLNSTNADTVTLEAPNNAGLPNGGSNTQAASYSLVLPYNAPSPGLCLETSNTDQNQLTFSACDNSNASISLVTTSDDTTSTSSIAGTTYAPSTAGNLVVVSFILPTAYTGSVSGITDSNVSGGFTKVNAIAESSGNYGRVEVWMGTATGTSTSNNMSFTYTGGTPGAGYEIVVSEYTAVGVNAGTTWGVDTSGTSSSTTAVGTITFPNLTTSDAGELYFGTANSASDDGQSNTGCTTNFTCTATTSHNLIAYDTASGANVSYTPVSTQSANSKYDTVGVAFIAYVSSTAINNQISVQQANYNVQASSSSTVAGVLQANSSQNADILDFYNGSAAQSTSTEVLSILGGSTTAGDIQFAGLTSETIAVTAQATANTTGASLTVSSANGNGTGAGGQLKLAAGNSGAGATGTGGEVLIQGGNATSTNGSGGNVLIQGGVKAGTGSTGSVIIQPETNDVTTAFEVQNAAGSNTVMDVDTTLGGTYSNSGVIINSDVAGVSGLKFAQLNSSSTFTTNFTDILGLDSSGNVGVSSVAVSLTSPALAYWDGTADPTGINNSYPQATVQSLGTTTYTPNFTTTNGEQLTDTNTAGNETGDINWNFAQVPFEEIQFQFKSGNGDGADGVWFYGYTDAVPKTEYGAGTMTKGYIIYFSEWHHCIGISYGPYSDGNQCNNGGGTTTGTGTSPLKSVSAPDLNDNNFHNVDIQIDYNVITVRYDGAVVLTEVDSVGRDTSGLNFGFGARTGGDYDNHYIKGLLVTKLGTGTSQYNIATDNNLADTAPDSSTTATGYGGLYWNNSDGYLGVGAGAASSTLEVDGTLADQNIVQAYNYNDTACEASGGTTQCNTSQTGPGIYSATQTVTAEGSSSFSSSWVGDKITWANGDSGMITAVGSSTSMTVSASALEGTQQYQITNPTAFNINSSGEVGIGTSSPGYDLDLQGNNGTGYIAHIENSSTATSAGTPGSSSDGLLIQLGTADASRTTGNYFVAFAGGTSGSGTVAGKIQGGASAVAYTTTGADYAEYFEANPSSLPQPGEIVSLDSSNSQSVVDSDGGAAVGIVSTNPGFIGNGPLCQVDDNNCDSDYQQYNVLVGLTGQVPTKVSVANGPINVGDPIMASPSNPGVGIKATGLSQIVGYAEQATTVDGTIQVFIQPGIFNPITANNVQGGGTPLTLNSDLEVTGNTTLDGSLTIAKDLTASSVTATSANVTGNLTVIGSVSAGSLTVSDNTTLQTLVVNGQSSFGGDIRLTGKVNTRQATIKTFTASKAITAGSVVVLDTTTGNEGNVTTTTTEGDTKVIGVAVTSSTQTGDSIDVAIGGWVQVNVDTTPDSNGNSPPALTPGELLVTSTNPGTIEASSSPAAGSILGKTTDNEDNNNQVWILITLQ